MTAPTLTGGYKPEEARTSGREIAGLISLGSALKQALGVVKEAFRQRQCEREANAVPRSEAMQISQVERGNSSAQFSAESANLRARAATLPDNAARPLSARARLFAEGRA